jgi:hypothetical protein
MRFVEDELRARSGVREMLGCVFSVLLGETELEIVIDPVVCISDLSLGIWEYLLLFASLSHGDIGPFIFDPTLWLFRVYGYAADRFS